MLKIAFTLKLTFSVIMVRISISEIISNHNLVILDVCQVSFGNNVMLGPNVMIATASHPLARRNTEFGQPISIGDDVRIGGYVSVLAGVSIGDNSVIGAGSVITKDITGNGVYTGNPCQFIKSI